MGLLEDMDRKPGEPCPACEFAPETPRHYHVCGVYDLVRVSLDRRRQIRLLTLKIEALEKALKDAEGKA